MADKNNKKFEDSLQELESIVKKLEGDVPLDEALAAFAKGVELGKTCMAELKKEEGKLDLLVNDLDKITEEFKIEK